MSALVSESVTPSKPFPYNHDCKTLQHSRGAATSMKKNSEVPSLMRKKRKRSSSTLRPPKNAEELESQRMVHITVERNRRKLMNEHLALLRTLMPSSYVQRGDQASIVGAAIEFVKELEQILHSLKGEKQRREECISSCILQKEEYLLTSSDEGRFDINPIMSNPCQGFRSTSTTISSSLSASSSSSSSSIYSSNEVISNSSSSSEGGSSLTRSRLHGHDNSSNCNVEVEVEVEVKVKVVGIDALLVNVMSPQKMGGKLLEIINALQFSLHLIIRHLNVTTIDHSVLYSFQVQMGVQTQMAQCARQVEIYLQQIVTTKKHNYALPLKSSY